MMRPMSDCGGMLNPFQYRAKNAHETMVECRNTGQRLCRKQSVDMMAKFRTRIDSAHARWENTNSITDPVRRRLNAITYQRILTIPSTYVIFNAYAVQSSCRTKRLSLYYLY